MRHAELKIENKGNRKLLGLVVCAALVSAALVPQVAGASEIDGVESSANEVVEAETPGDLPDEPALELENQDEKDVEQGELEESNPSGTEAEGSVEALEEVLDQSSGDDADDEDDGFCKPGIYYSISNSGVIDAYHAPGQKPVDIPDLDLGDSKYLDGSFRSGEFQRVNGLGISPNGVVYALSQYKEWKATVMPWDTYWDLTGEFYAEVQYYDPAVGEWRKGATLNTPNSDEITWVAGGVDPRSHKYYFGRFTDLSVIDSEVEPEVEEETDLVITREVDYKFELYRSDGKVIEPLGVVHPREAIEIPKEFSSNGFLLRTGNGDLAFDALGNLHIVNGHPDGAEILTVPRETLDSMNTDSSVEVAVSHVKSSDLSTIVGAAFNSDGTMQLSHGRFDLDYSNHFTFNPTTGATSTPTSHGASVDLASCVVPPTLTVVKHLEKPRYSDDHQFLLSILKKEKDDSFTTLIENETSGTGADVQGLVTSSVIAGTEYGIGESLLSGAKPLNEPVYSSSWSCVDQYGRPVSTMDGEKAAGTGTFGSIYVPAVVPSEDGTSAEVANIRCTFTNVPTVGSVSWEKRGGSKDGALPAGSEWTLTPVDDEGNATGKAITVKDNQEGDSNTDDGRFRYDYIPFGTYQLREQKAPQGYIRIEDPVTVTVSSDKPHYNVGPVINEEMPGSVSWSKVDKETRELLGKSEWTLTTGDPNETVYEQITDCDAADVTLCNGLDKDPEKGAFKLVGLKWGDYRLIETLAPAGYIIDSEPHKFAIGADEEVRKLNWEFDPITNVKVVGPSIPLTGGMSRDAYILGGGAFLAVGLAVYGAYGFRRRNA
ncbi:MAG: SpaA isopeptide-forming pilin-related protein [Actinomycetaceae bacterium]|nr:SpaA isopeptide-forming pilin-related protein [Actinomycetaceae bacterium]